MGVSVKFEHLGWAEQVDERGPFDFVSLADYELPRVVRAVFPGDGTQPGLELRLEVIDGLPQLRELHLVSADGGRDVRAVDLSNINITEWVDTIFAALSMKAERSADGRKIAIKAPNAETEAGAIGEFHAARRGRAVRQITPGRLEKAAEQYEEHFDNEPIKHVAQFFGVSERTASDYITRARRAGILPPTTRGKKRKRDGQPTKAPEIAPPSQEERIAAHRARVAERKRAIAAGEIR